MMRNILFFLILLLIVFPQPHFFAQIDDITRLPVKNITAQVQEIVNNNFDPNILSVNNDPVKVSGYYLHQNYPNPFNPTTTIRFEIPQDGVVTIKIFDIFGQEVTTILNEFQKADRYEVVFNSIGLSSGVYIYRMKVNEFIQSNKMILLK